MNLKIDPFTFFVCDQQNRIVTKHYFISWNWWRPVVVQSGDKNYKCSCRGGKLI